MTFVKGVSGNPGGRPQEKLVTEALRTAALRTDKEGKTKLYRMADTIINKAIAGEAWAAQMVADRLEGKPLHQSATSVEMGPSELFLEILRGMNERPLSDDATETIQHSTNGQDQPAANGAVAAVRLASTPAPSTGSWLIQYEAEQQQTIGLDR